MKRLRRRIKIASHAGSFGGDKDVAAEVRDKLVTPALRNDGRVTLDFDGVDLATQSFVHALLSTLIREEPTVLERISFVNCNASVQELIEIVAEYSQEEL
jgi:hypothetical protein